MKMAIYSYLFGVIVAFVSYVIYQKYANVYSSIVIKPHKRYDYIIVGAGTAGCVLAARLSEDPKTKVLLIEAGDHMGYFTKIPMTPTVAQQGPNDWSFQSTRQKYSSFGLYNQTQFLPRGKGLGGSGQINFLLHGIGLPSDYDKWTTLGFTGWTWKDLKPYFVKAFGSGKSEFDSEKCALNGYCPAEKAPMKLKTISEDNHLLQAFKKASSLTKDKQTVFRKATATVKDGVRFTSYDAYLRPALKRHNLHVLLNTQAVSIHFENKTATSVFILQNHRELNNIFVKKEIILAAGAIKTPQILLLSGIGPKQAVKRLKVPLISENNNVGANLHDHMNVPLYVSVNKPVSVTLAKLFDVTAVWDYYFSGKGLLSFPPIAGVEYQNETAVMLFSMGTTSERLLRDLSNYDPKVFRATFPFYNLTHKEGFMFLSTCTQPRSRGKITVTRPTTVAKPKVDPMYLKIGADVQCMVRALRRSEELIWSQPFQELGAKIHWPRPERCLSLWKYSRDEQIGSQLKKTTTQPYTLPYYSDQQTQSKKENIASNPSSPPNEYLECIAREIGVTGHHSGGSCAGGKVVDSQLRVKQISGLRVMDASVFPSPTSLYPNSVIVAMAERASDIIRGVV